MSANLENSAVTTGQENVSFNSNPKEKQCQRMLKLPHNCTHFTCQPSNAQNSPNRLQQYVNHEIPDVQAEFRKSRGTRNKIVNIRWIIKKSKELQKNLYFCFIDYAKAFVCVDHNKLENSSRDGNTRPPDLPLEKSVCRSRRNSLELNMEQTASKLGKGVCQGTPLQYSCLENTMDGGAWWAAVHGVARSRTQLSDLAAIFYSHCIYLENDLHSMQKSLMEREWRGIFYQTLCSYTQKA